MATYYRHHGHDVPLDAVILTGVHVPFWDLVWLLVKLAFAAIPAAIIIAIIWTVFYWILGALGIGPFTLIHHQT
jgi:hypothetical protein